MEIEATRLLRLCGLLLDSVGDIPEGLRNSGHREDACDAKFAFDRIGHHVIIIRSEDKCLKHA